LLTIVWLHILFAVYVVPLFRRPGAKRPRGSWLGDKPEWQGVKQIQVWSIACGPASIGSGTNEMGADEEKVVRLTGWSFGLLAFFMLGLTILNHL
jgi:hypothetical protein